MVESEVHLAKQLGVFHQVSHDEHLLIHSGKEDVVEVLTSFRIINRCLSALNLVLLIL